MADNIVLIGFMGIGKGQVGRALAEKSSKMLIDCDDMIESAANKKIKAIFDEEGEESFRAMERKVASWLEGHVSGTIISTGGGFLNVPNLKKIGTVVYLCGEFDNIIARILAHPNSEKKLKKRPLLADMEKAREIYEKRLPLYEKYGEIKVNMDLFTPTEAACYICGKLDL